MNRPLLPSDLRKADPLLAWRRYVTAKTIGGGWNVEDIVRRLWGDDPKAVDAILKSAVSPATTTTSGWASQLVPPTAVGAFLQSLRPRSAAAQLFTTPLSMAGHKQMLLPQLASDWPAPTFVAEGGSIPVYSGSFGSVTLGPPGKLAAMAAINGELERYGAEDAEALVTALMDDAAARALDAAVFSTTAASSTRPAGLLNGVSAITADAGSGLDAMLADIQALIGAIVTAGGGSSILIFANPVQAVALNVLAANGIGYPVIPTPALAAGTVVAIEQGAIASGFPNLPVVDTSKEALIHFDDATPLAIGTAGTPNTVAAPVKSAFQSDFLVLRLIMPCAWVARGSGFVQYLTGASW